MLCHIKQIKLYKFQNADSSRVIDTRKKKCYENATPISQARLSHGENKNKNLMCLDGERSLSTGPDF